MSTGMYEYVEREEIRRAYEKLTRSYVNGDPYIADWRFDEMIENLHASDVAPVRHGHWIKTGSYACGENEYLCSECKETEWRTSAFRLKYCPFCGAKMDGGAD